MESFYVVKDYKYHIKRFGLMGHKLEFRMNPTDASGNPTSYIKQGVRNILGLVTRGLEPTDKVGITFCGQKFERTPGWMNFQDAGDIKLEDVWDMIQKVFQSNSEGLSTDTFCIGLTSVRMPRGKGRGHKYNSFDEECAASKGIVVINNKDNLCLLRAIVVARAHVDKDPDYVRVRKNTGRMQTARAELLIKDTGLVIPPNGCSVVELQYLQQKMPGYKITVYIFGTKGREILFSGPEAPRKINLLYSEGHYNVIRLLTAAFCCSYYCEVCHIPYNTKTQHRCASSCPCCQHEPVCPRTSEILCSDCNRQFRGAVCFNNHLKNLCGSIKRCLECLKVYKAERVHVCGEVFCKNCRAHYPSNHQCYIRPDERSPPTEDFLFVFYDLETRQETQINDDYIHEPNLCVFNQRCHMCLAMNSTNTFCGKCGIRSHILRVDPIATFMRFVINQRKLFKQVVVMAHNGGGFDHQFLLKYVLEKTNLKPELIMRGTRIILMQLENVKFIDSINYFPMALSALPKAFGMSSEKFKKGYFPHLFNTLSNQNYIGPLPEVHYYNPDSMKPEPRKEFLAWHESQKQTSFDFQKEFIEYCTSDVNILTGAALKFREIMLKECNICPFLEATTIASACNLVFRRNFLKPNTIGLIPKNGYRLCDNQSSIAIKWMIWEEDERKISIAHAANGKEIILNGIKVDGYSAETNQVFEFHGCYFHGHECLKYNRDVPLHENTEDTLNRRFQATEAKIERLRTRGYDVIEKWECEFRTEMKQHDQLMQYLDTHPLLINTPLNPRDAFYGGRSGNTYKHYACKADEKIKYVDVCSLYPWVCKYGKFPTGHPTVIVGDEECSKYDLSSTDGLIKCTILPPQDLYHPVLPCKMNNKLMFVLCRKCGDQLNAGACEHSENERALTGTWVIDEVLKAQEKGYKILKFFEMWVYEVAQLDKECALSSVSMHGLFGGFINRFVKMKQEASGWPSHCTTQDEKERYIEEFMDRENVKMEYNNITSNPGLRCLAKLILNSFWGKYGQKENQPKTSIVRKPEELFAILSNPSVIVNTITPIDDIAVIVNWEYKEEAADTLNIVNVCIAAYTTTGARLKLYNYLDCLGDRVLYYDTDSVMYVSKPHLPDIETGNCLGEMTDELESYGSGSYITEFCCGGPKNYAYEVFSPLTQKYETEVKVKGFKLNFKNRQLINLESMAALINNDDVDDKIVVVDNQIQRTTKHDVVTVETKKKYRITSNKRRFSEDHSSTPYGFIKRPNIDN